MKQKLNLTSIILMAVNIVCIFIPGFYSLKIWMAKGSSLGGLTHVRTEAVSSFYVSAGFTIVLLLAVGVAIAIMLNAFFRQNDSVAVKNAYLAPVAALAVLLLKIIIVGLGLCDSFSPTSHMAFVPSFVAYIALGLQLVAAILAVVARFKTFSETPKTVNMVNSSASELQEFKHLLDSGVITQEEFEAKKKQLLNL